MGPAFVAPGSPWQIGVVESVGRKPREELLNRGGFRSRAAAKVLIERWRQFYDGRQPHATHRYNFPPPSVRPGWVPIISTRDSATDWLQNSTACHVVASLIFGSQANAIVTSVTPTTSIGTTIGHAPS
ncbi:hypothetical protein C5615_12700 [Burkholderia cepacia]|uniref:Integrase catalytic domain-containing protein n=1 Tax=Burkholderia cepacia TaxID=292 RepID=A0A2S8IV89_BURCE|nr:hypothetical protein C5615_12700 [Burkholderia cepacia]HDR9505667.1 transposase [Burkholderia cepacia]